MRTVSMAMAVGMFCLSSGYAPRSAAAAQWIKKKVCKDGVTVFALKGVQDDEVKGPNGGYTIGTLHEGDVIKVRADSFHNKRFAVAKAPRCGKWANGQRLGGVQINSIKPCPTVP